MAGSAAGNRARFTAAELVQVTGGRLDRPVDVVGVSTDSRSVEAGQLFVALAGDRFDGHDHVDEAAARGAAAVLVSRPAAVDRPQLLVTDTLSALQALAAHHRGRFAGPVVAIGGSNGKTTTKELTAAALSPLGPIHRTPGNQNNHIGVPLTLLGLESTARAAVIELGMNHSGEMRALARLARPGLAVITNVGREHLAGLGSRRAVMDAELEVVESLDDSDTLILHGDDDELLAAARRFRCRRVTFGFGRNNRCVATGVVEQGLDGIAFDVDGFPRVTLTLPGRHNALNALAALAVSRELGVPPAEAVGALAGVRPVGGRSRVVRAGGLRILDDSYNANPESMLAALALLMSTPTSGRRLAVLGEMLEMGAAAADVHREIGAAAAFVDRLYVLGPSAIELVAGATARGLAPTRIFVAQDIESLIARVTAESAADDLVLVKGSRGMALEKVVAALLDTGAPAGGGR